MDSVRPPPPRVLVVPLSILIPKDLVRVQIEYFYHLIYAICSMIIIGRIDQSCKHGIEKTTRRKITETIQRHLWYYDIRKGFVEVA